MSKIQPPLFNVGDPVWSLLHGYGKVSSVEREQPHNISVRFNAYKERYALHFTNDGRISPHTPQTLTPLNFGLGDEVDWCGMKGKIVGITEIGKYPIKTDIPDYEWYRASFTLDGKYYQAHTVPSLFLIHRAEIEVPEEKKTITKEDLKNAMQEDPSQVYIDSLWNLLK